MKILNIQDGLDLKLQTTFINNQQLMSSEHDLSINLLFAELVKLNDWLEIHDLMIRLDELLDHLLCGYLEILHFLLDLITIELKIL